MALSRTTDVSKQLQSFSAAITASPAKEKEPDKSVMISMRIPQSTRNELKAFFASHGMSLSCGLIASANFLKLEEQMGAVTVSNGIVIKRR
jgi:hypothetical protein